MADYTVLPIGTTDAGEIAVCVHCGRNGLVEVTNGMTFYVHKTGEGMKGEDVPLIGWDQCPVPLEIPTSY